MVFVPEISTAPVRNGPVNKLEILPDHHLNHFPLKPDSGPLAELCFWTAKIHTHPY
jgi:hypothetical protein